MKEMKFCRGIHPKPKVHLSTKIKTMYDLSEYKIWDKIWPLTVWVNKDFTKILVNINTNINY